MANYLAILATIAGIVLSIGYFPQAYKIYKRKHAKDVSPLTYLLFLFGVTVWLIYGISLGDPPLIISNIVALIGCACVLIAYQIYKK